MFYKGFSIRQYGDKFEVINLETGKRFWRSSMQKAKWAVSVLVNLNNQMGA